MKINDAVSKRSRILRVNFSAKAYPRQRQAGDEDDHGAGSKARRARAEPYLRAKQRELTSAYGLDENEGEAEAVAVAEVDEDEDADAPEPENRPAGKLRAGDADGWEETEQEPQDWIDAEHEVQRMLGIDEFDDFPR